MYTSMPLLIFFLFNYIIAINAFNPVSLPTSGSPNSATHEAITRCAVATITSEYIQTRFNITIPVPTITNGICPSSFFYQIKTNFSQVNSKGGNTYADWETTLDYIVARNAIVDVAEQTDASRHFDSESFVEASTVIIQRYQLAIKALNSFDYTTANEYFGKMTHTLQDFYSHSNWMELNQRQPYPGLGLNITTPAQFAGPKVRTCSNCATGTSAVCYSNNDITKGLTSGYYVLLFDIFTKKPVGKCSHGGSTDATRNNDAIGGINKDTLESIHGYLHEPAAQTAYLATCKILRQFRTQVQDTAFGQFLNILSRKKTSSRSFLPTTSESLNLDPALVYTNILNNVRQANTFSLIQQIVSLPAIDSYYKAHILSIAKDKHLTIDIFRNSMFRQNYFDFGQDLAKLTGGLYLFYYNKTRANINTNTNEQTEFIDLFYSKHTSDSISITVDSTCSSLLLEFITNDTIPSLVIQLQNSDQFISPSSIVTNIDYYRSYLFSNIPSGNWKLIFLSSVKFTFNLRVSCSSEFRCFSSLYVDNDNSVHPGVVELEGNLIQNHDAFLITTCDDTNVKLTDMFVTMVDELNGNIIGNLFQSIYDSNNDRWITNLTNIPSNSFRLKFLINNQQIQRLSHISYQPSLVDVEIYQINTTSKTKTIVKYRLYNYHQKPVKINFIAKNIGTYMKTKTYSLKASETHDDQIEFDQNTKASYMTGNMLALTITASTTDWNYDVISI